MNIVVTLAIVVTSAAVIGFAMVALAGPLYRTGLLELGPAFVSMKFGVYVGLAALVLLIVQGIFARKTMKLSTSVLAIVCIVIAVGIPSAMRKKAESLPFIHDISTDVENPPAFVGVLPFRTDAKNPAEYAGDEVAAEQKKGYPDLDTQVFSASVEDVLAAANSVVDGFGWDKVESGSAANTIEATHQTFWFGFKDDVVIRIRDNGGKTEVDVRSKSRVGQSDLGVNAGRIRDFQQALAAKVS